MRNHRILSVVALVGFSSGCHCMQGMEQWKCDNLGMCHFAQPRPGVYSPMVLPPSYGAPPSGLAPVAYPQANPNMVYPPAAIGGVVPGTSGTPMNTMPAYVAPPRAAPPASPYTIQGQGMSNTAGCRDCQN